MNIVEAVEHHIAGRFAEAEALYQQILEAEPRHADALYLMGMLAQQRGDIAGALDFTARAIAAHPLNPLYRKTLADLHAGQGRLDEALALYRQAQAFAPDDVELHCKLAGTLHRLRRFDEAAAAYAQALARSPEAAGIHNDLGVVQIARGDLDAAILGFQRAIALKPDFCEAYNNLGVVHKNRKQLDEAAQCYRRALAIKPDYAMAMFNLGTIHFVQKDFEEARLRYHAALEIEPGQVEAHQNLASIYLDRGELEEAQRHRDLAYGQQAVFIDTAPEPMRSVLVLWAAGKGNVPIDFLFPKELVTRIVWMMEYATEAQQRALPHYDLVFNAIGDPDVTGPTAAPVARFLRDCGKPVFNRPEAVERTARDRLPDLLAGIAGIVVPRTVRLDTSKVAQQLAAPSGIGFPVIVRPSGSHGGDHLLRLKSAADLDGFTPFNAPSYYATGYADYQSPDGFYRKYRIAYVDRKPYPYHLAISPHWIVHYDTAEMPGHAWKLDEEQRFLANPLEALGADVMAAIEAIGRTLDLDYCGIDFSILPDGRVLVFEANATMLVHPEPAASPLAFKNHYVGRIFEAFNTMLDRSRRA